MSLAERRMELKKFKRFGKDWEMPVGRAVLPLLLSSTKEDGETAKEEIFQTWNPVPQLGCSSETQVCLINFTGLKGTIKRQFQKKGMSQGP